MNIGNTIKMLRNAAGMSQKEFAKQTGVSSSLVSLIESGSREPTIIYLRTVSKVTGAPFSALFAQSGDAPDNLTESQASDYVRVQQLLADTVTTLVMEKLRPDEVYHAN